MAAVSSYSGYVPQDKLYNECPCCYELLITDVVAHDDKLHPIHRKCIKIWAELKATCPECRTPFDKDSLVTPLERMRNTLGSIGSLVLASEVYTGVAATTSNTKFFLKVAAIGIGASALMMKGYVKGCLIEGPPSEDRAILWAKMAASALLIGSSVGFGTCLSRIGGELAEQITGNSGINQIASAISGALAFHTTIIALRAMAAWQ